jgi:dipeptide/tripeptide permease
MEKLGTLQIIGSLILILGGIAGIFWYFTKQMEKTFDVFTKQIEERFKIFTDNIEKRFETFIHNSEKKV